MNITREKTVMVEEDAARRENLRTMLDMSGYDVAAFATAHEALEAIHSGEVTLLLIDADAGQASEAIGSKARDIIATIRGSAATEMVRVILLVGSGAEQRIEA
jgi:CheY-like chemotaxis protein